MRVQKILFLLLFLVASCAEDTRNWIETKIPDAKLYYVYWTGTNFVTFGVDNQSKIVSGQSVDGFNWQFTSQNQLIINYSLLFNKILSQFILNNSNDVQKEILVSTDLANWTSISADTSVSCQLVYNGQKYFSCGEIPDINGCAKIVSSVNLAQWTEHVIEDNWCFNDLYFENNKFFAKIHFKNGAPDHYAYVRSNDGLHWQEINRFCGRYMNQITYADKFYMVGDWGGIYTSTDGKEWEDHSMFLGPPFKQIVRSASEYFVLPVTDNEEIWSTSDLLTWKSYLYIKAIPFPSNIFNESTGKLWDMATNGVVTVVVGEGEVGWDGIQYGVILTTE